MVIKKRTTGRVPWSQDELRLLRRLFPLGKARDVAEKTERPLSAVRQKAYSLGLRTRDNRLWSASEIKTVARLYPVESARSIAGKLGRTLEAVHARAQSIGVKKAESYGPAPWSKRADDLPKKLYPDQENAKPEIAKQIGRSTAAVAGRACALGLRRRNLPWSKKEMSLLRKLYPTRTSEQIAEQIGRSVQATRTHISRSGIKKRR